MIDFHSHVLPGLDDGAKTMEDSLALLHQLHAQQVTDLVLTPHFHPDMQSLDQFLTDRKLSYSRFLETADRPMRFFLGAEVYGNEFLLISQQLASLCIRGTNLLLLEMPFSDEWTSDSWRMIRKITDDHAILPVIAHAERYPALRKHPVKLLNRLIDAGCIIQANCDSFVEPAIQDFMLRCLGDGLFHLLGTDCHDIVRRPPRMAEAGEVITRALGVGALERLEANGARLLAGKPLRGQNLFF